MPASLPDLPQCLAQAQCGVLTYGQAISGGLTADMIKRRVRTGRWQLLHRGVYATFSGPPGREATLWAAVLRAGPGALLSHHTAAELDGLIDKAMPLIHVSIPVSRRATAIRGVAVHRSEHASRCRHPARTPPRTRFEDTVIDLTQLAVSFDDACGWVTRALGRRLTTIPRLRDSLAGRARLRWRDELSQLLTADWDGVHSSLEYRYVRDVERRHRLPRGRRQAPGSRSGRALYRDVLYDEHRVAVELDGRAAHPGDTRWADIRRDNAAAAAGIITLRFGWLDVSQHPCQCAAQVAQALRRRGRSQSAPCSPGCPVVAAG